MQLLFNFGNKLIFIVIVIVIETGVPFDAFASLQPHGIWIWIWNPDQVLV